MQTIFLDRDGVINRNRPRGDYVKSWKEFQFLPYRLALDLADAARLILNGEVLPSDEPLGLQGHSRKD